ncbi:uncharacterized protein BYT42DRAFT_585134 [Radiomyces spectabilis]|uniref:uncharacterized protein n=1 Tax=Radiomyces spectabilis TaxID=64574 RepID=UPI00221E3CA6|nr:uncharacterized protein BYT42DRAFT_585134 [Radiomyces spectabilis]KAI8369626.1 hypothetical protein BYT42DRAFT_585134 [Radiomyces spectabilis]
MSVVREIPVIDFGGEPDKVAQEVLNACKSIGFFYMINHGIPREDIQRAFQLSKDFFNQPVEDKRKYARTPENHGYAELYSERLDPEHQRQGDHKEAFNFKNFINGKAFAPLPPLFEKDQAFIEHFSRTCHNTAVRVLEFFAMALSIPESEGGKRWFADRHGYDKETGEALRFLKYPRGGEAVYKEVVRAGAHSDYGSVTLLFQKDVPGLEVQASRTEWISAPIIDKAIVVNVGDQMEFWTNGLFKSTLHRVTFLPEHNQLDRYSIAYFLHAEDDVPLAAIPSPLITPKDSKEHVPTAAEHLRERLDKSYMAK